MTTRTGPNPMSEPISANTEAKPSALDVEELMVFTRPCHPECLIPDLYADEDFRPMVCGSFVADPLDDELCDKCSHDAKCHTPLISQ